MLAERARLDGDRIALATDGGDRLSFDQWQRRSAAVASGLAGAGVGAGDRVGLAFDTAGFLDNAVAYAAVHHLGALPVVLGQGAGAADLAAVLAQDKVKLVLGSAAAVPDGAWRVAAVTEMEAQAGAAPVPAPRPPDPVEVLWRFLPLRRPTSSAVAAADLAAPLVDGTLPGACLLAAFAPATTPAQWLLRLPLVQGRTVVAVGSFETRRFVARAAEADVGWVGLAAPLARAVADSGAPHAHDLSSVELVVVGGPLAPEVVTALRGIFGAARVAVLGADDVHTTAGAERSERPGGHRVAPAAPEQSGLVWREQVRPGAGNDVPLAYRVKGPLHVPALGAALGEVARRHQVLRTTFELRDGRAVQLVGDVPDEILAVSDLRGLPPGQHQSELAGVLAAVATAPVDLVRGPLFSARLLRLGDEDHVLVLAVHHSAWDHWSENVLCRELSSIYAAFAAGRPLPLDEPARQFADVAEDQCRWLDGPAARAQLEWWRDELAGAPLGLQLPVNDPALPAGTPHPSVEPITIELPPPLAASIRALARSHRATLFIAMLAAFAVVVQRWTDDDDQLTTSFVANREQPDVEGLVGCFFKALPLRVRLTGDPTFAELVGRVREVVLGGLAHQDLPHDVILREVLGPSAAAHGLVPAPLLWFMGVHDEGGLELDGLDVCTVDTDAVRAERVGVMAGGRPSPGPARPWGMGVYRGALLGITLLEEGERVSCRAEGSYHPPAVERLLDDYRRVLEEVAADPGRLVSQLAAEARPPTDDSPAVRFRGFRIRPWEVQAALGTCPGVREVAVVLRADDPVDPRLVAYVVADGVGPSLDDLRRHLWTVRPGDIWPAAVVMLDALPRDAHGRLDLDALPSPDSVVPEAAGAEAALLGSLWAHAGGGGPAGSSYWLSFPFLDALAVARAAGVSVPTALVARNRTVEALGVALAAGRAVAGDRQPPGGPGARSNDRPASAAGGDGSEGPGDRDWIFPRQPLAEGHGAEPADLLAAWGARLAGAPPALDLPCDRRHRPEGVGRTASWPLAVPHEVAAAAEAMTAAAGGDLLAVLTTALDLVLARYGNAEDLLVATRTEGDMVVVRADLAGNPTCAEALARVQEAVTWALDHQGVPFRSLVAATGVAAGAGRHPPVRVSLQVAPAPPPDRVADGLDLEVFVAPSAGGGLAGAMVYATDLFDPPTVERMAAHLLAALRAVVGDPARPVLDVDLLTEAERELVMRASGAIPATDPARPCLHQLFEQQAATVPDAPAACYEGTTLTYGELDGASNRLAHHLRELGVGAESVVGICLDRGLDMVVGLLGILKAGGAYLPLDHDYPSDRLAFMVDDAGVALVVTHGDLSDRLPLDRIRLVRLDADGPDIARRPGCCPPPVGGPDSLAYVLYTSGSTGRPKGVEVTHRSVVSFLAAMCRWPGLAPDDVMLALTTLSFDVAGVELYLPLVTGAKVVVGPRVAASDPHRLMALIEASGATVMPATPATWRMLVDAGWPGRPGLRVWSAGEALSPELADQLLSRQVELYNMYGPTEATIYATGTRVLPGSPVTIGRPLANTTAHVFDGRCRPVPVGVAGELYLGGQGLARGYLGRPDLTAERFVDDPLEPGIRLYRTGDLARWRGDGTIEYLGRLDHQVKVRGFRIELGEVEAVLAAQPAVRATVVTAREDIAGDPRLVAYVVPRDPVPGDLIAKLRAALEASLPPYMVPAAFVSLPALPLTPAGKVDRRSLPAPDYRAMGPASAFVAPRTALERTVADVWAEVLGHGDVGVHDDFFDLGGHSLLAAKVVSRLRQNLGVDLAVAAIFDGPTVAELAGRVAATLTPPTNQAPSS